ncbi:conserved membrane hypothetical protein [Tenacibaculum sp. 190524A02b]|uniref:Polysaccharide biosynthesis protein n=1 Tax=Tenacibaculum vairaonense TaxID=3137860 RepID=A0ABP1FBM9_9FLAO
MKQTIKVFLSNQKKYLWFIVVRILSFLIIGFETFFGPKIIGIDAYGIIEYEKQVISLSAIFLLGLHTGYSVQFYKSEKEQGFGPFLFFGFMHILAVFLIYSFVTKTFSFGIMFFLFSILIEQILKIKNKFNLAILFKPLFSILLVAYYLYYYVSSNNIISFIFDLNLIYSLAFIVFILIVLSHLLFKDKDKLKLDFKTYKQYLKEGFQPNLTSSLILVFFFIDRFLIEKYYGNFLGVYSVAYNFAVISFLVASSVGYVTTIKIGEKLNEFKELKKIVSKLINYSYLYIFFVLLFGGPVIFYLNKNWFMIDGFEKIALINLTGRTFFGAAIFYTSVIYYKNKEYYSWSCLLFFILTILAIDFYLIKNNIGDYMTIQYVSNILLVIYAVFMNYVVRKKILIE